ncbi:MAG: NapC/NirT family cytochrome c [Desulfovibrio sp.]|jgi:cytochrome c nitrite reductase small subunit|nr:NapC/NirT family cytochrome c [Desulfovibrio sp.]
MVGPRNSCLKPLVYGVALGLVLVAVFSYGMSTTDQRPFCASCHLMQEAAVTHRMGTHADQSCNECHAPSALSAKLPFKAQVGLHDIVANSSGKDLPYPVSKDMRVVINENCKRCHAQTNVDVATMDVKTYCVDCHRNVAHMRAKQISTRMVAYD